VIERMMKIQSDATPWNREVIECLILCALARAATHESQGAHSNLQRALRLAVPEGFVRIFVDEGEPMRRLLSDFCSQTPDSRRPSPSQDAAGLSAYARRLLSAFPSPEAEPFLRSAQLPEQISEREHEVLLLIARGLSNQQIAAELVVSVSTVKTHINNLYGKIGARSRTQALAKGRQLGIIER
jgi:LuxR family maltose regulon positive regulatory protein